MPVSKGEATEEDLQSMHMITRIFCVLPERRHSLQSLVHGIRILLFDFGPYIVSFFAEEGFMSIVSAYKKLMGEKN